MRILLLGLAMLFCLGAVCAEPSPERMKEMSDFMLKKSDMPAFKMTSNFATEWIMTLEDESGTKVIVPSLSQRWWRQGTNTEIIIEACVFENQEDALCAAEERVEYLKTRFYLEDKVLKGGKLPGQAQGDRAWGLWDPPETGAKPNACRRVGPRSSMAVVVFVKKNICVQIKIESSTISVDLEDMEKLAKKIAENIKKTQVGNNEVEKDKNSKD